MNSSNIIHITFNDNWNFSSWAFINFEQFDLLINSNKFYSIWGEVNSPLIVNIIKLNTHSWVLNNSNSVNLRRMVNLALTHPYIAYTDLNTNLTHIFTLTHSESTRYLIFDNLQHFSSKCVFNSYLSSLDLNFKNEIQYINNIPLILKNDDYKLLLNNFNNATLQQNYLTYSLISSNNLSSAYEIFQSIRHNKKYPSVLIENIEIKNNKIFSDVVLKNWNLSNFEVCKISADIEGKYK